MKTHFQLFSKALGVFFICSTAAYLFIALGFVLATILSFQGGFGGFSGFLGFLWRAALSGVLSAAGPLALGYYLTQDDNVFVALCYPPAGAAEAPPAPR